MKKIAILFTVFGLLLISCSNEEESKDKNDITEGEFNNVSERNSENETEDTIAKPPELTISAGEANIRPALGTYSWQYTNGDGTDTGINADSSAPPTLVENHKPTKVTTDTNIELEFEKPPESYSVRIWNSDNSVESGSNNIDLTAQEGEVVYEVLAHWEQGTASYAFILHVE